MRERNHISISFMLFVCSLIDVTLSYHGDEHHMSVLSGALAEADAVSSLTQ